MYQIRDFQPTTKLKGECKLADLGLFLIAGVIGGGIFILLGKIHEELVKIRNDRELRRI